MSESQDFRKHRRERTSSRQGERARGTKRDLKVGFGCLLSFCIVALGFFVGTGVGILLVYVFLQALSAAALMNEYAVIGIFLGLFCAFTANPALLRLCFRLKRRHLQRHGIAVEARVVHQERISLYNPRGPAGDQFELTLRWQQPETGQSYKYVHTYRYVFGLSRKKREQFWADYRSGAPLPILFSPKHPWYYVVDIPFIPTWFDVLF
jgi:hypothetical protein